VNAARIPGGIRLIDLAATAVVIAAVELNVATATGPSQKPLNAVAYLAGAAMCLPVLIRRRWPLRELLGCAVLLLFYYIFDRRNISPAPLLCLPLYDTAAAGYLAWSIVIPAFYMVVGFFVVDASSHQGVGSLTADFLQSGAVLFLAVLLGEVVRSRKALAAQTAERLRLAAEEQEAEAARRVAEERLRIARDLHDTVAHSMATITVQAGSALHVLDGRLTGVEGLRDALTAIRSTSKSALHDIRATLGRLRGEDERDAGSEHPAAGLERLGALADAVTAAGAPVALAVEGEQVALPPEVDYAAYRILQESLTNVLRHAGPQASAAVRLRYEPGGLTIRVSDDGSGPAGPSDGRTGPADGRAGPTDGRAGAADGRDGPADGRDGAADGARPADGRAGSMDWTGHGITGMAERAAALGGELTAGPRPGGGFEVVARLPARPTERAS
jgi:signal transduction histidine kinase